MSGFAWIAGRPSLDLCNTRVGGVELLAEPSDLAEWLSEAGLGQPECAPDAQDVARVQEVREGLREAFLAGAPERIADLVEEWFRATPGRLEIDRNSLMTSFCPDVATCRCMLVPVLLDAVELAREEIRRVRECASERCSMVYLDSSRNGSRRWCSMERCGARAKAHAYYARKRGAC